MPHSHRRRTDSSPQEPQEDEPTPPPTPPPLPHLRPGFVPYPSTSYIICLLTTMLPNIAVIFFVKDVAPNAMIVAVHTTIYFLFGILVVIGLGFVSWVFGIHYFFRILYTSATGTVAILVVGCISKNFEFDMVMLNMSHLAYILNFYAYLFYTIKEILVNLFLVWTLSEEVWSLPDGTFPVIPEYLMTNPQPILDTPTRRGAAPVENSPETPPSRPRPNNPYRRRR